jgi:hypothetical protein
MLMVLAAAPGAAVVAGPPVTVVVVAAALGVVVVDDEELLLPQAPAPSVKSSADARAPVRENRIRQPPESSSYLVTGTTWEVSHPDLRVTIFTRLR